MNSTAREIINLWVSRMIMTGLEFMGEVPFRDVAIHCVVQASDGRRMSKSLGTGVDPRDLMTKYGSDALRAWAAFVLAGRLLGTAGFGEVGMIQSTQGLFGVLAGAGLGLAATKYVAEYRSALVQ